MRIDPMASGANGPAPVLFVTIPTANMKMNVPTNSTASLRWSSGVMRRPSSTAARENLRVLAGESAEDRERVPRRDLRNHLAARLDLNLGVRGLVAQPL